MTRTLQNFLNKMQWLQSSVLINLKLFDFALISEQSTLLRIQFRAPLHSMEHQKQMVVSWPRFSIVAVKN